MVVLVVLGIILIAAIIVLKTSRSSPEEIESVAAGSCDEPPPLAPPSTKKRVRITPPESNICHHDTLSVEERSKLWITVRELKLYKKNAIESIDRYRACNGNTKATLVDDDDDSEEYCMGGLESFYEEAELTRKEVQEYHVDCTLALQEENALAKTTCTRRNRLISTIKKLNHEEAAKALKRASVDRSAADKIYQEEDTIVRLSSQTKLIGKAKIKPTASRLKMVEEPFPRMKFARTA